MMQFDPLPVIDLSKACGNLSDASLAAEQLVAVIADAVYLDETTFAESLDQSAWVMKLQVRMRP